MRCIILSHDIATRQSDLLLPDNDRSYSQDDCTEDSKDDTFNKSNEQLINLPVRNTYTYNNVALTVYSITTENNPINENAVVNR